MHLPGSRLQAGARGRSVSVVCACPSVGAGVTAVTAAASGWSSGRWLPGAGGCAVPSACGPELATRCWWDVGSDHQHPGKVTPSAWHRVHGLSSPVRSPGDNPPSEYPAWSCFLRPERGHPRKPLGLQGRPARAVPALRAEQTELQGQRCWTGGDEPAPHSLVTSQEFPPSFDSLPLAAN